MATKFQTCMKRTLKGKRVRGKTRWRAAFKAAARKCARQAKYTRAGLLVKRGRRRGRRRKGRKARRVTRRVRRAARARRGRKYIGKIHCYITK